MDICSKLWISVDQNCEYRWIKNVPFVWIKIIYTGWCRTLVEISTKLRHRCRSVVEFWYTCRPNFDQTSTKPRHPQCRSLVEVCSTYKWNTFESQGVRSTVDQTLTPNFDTPSVEVCLEFRPNFAQTSTRHLGVEVWSKCVSVLIKIVYIIYSKLWIFVAQNCEILTVRIVNIVWPKLWIFVGQNCGYLLIKIVNICWSRLCISFWKQYMVSIWL